MGMGMVVLTATGSTMSGLLGDLSTVGTEVLGTVGEVITTIVSNPLTLFTTGILFLGGAVGILGRLLSRS